MRRPPQRAKQTSATSQDAAPAPHGIPHWRHGSKRWCWPENAIARGSSSAISSRTISGARFESLTATSATRTMPMRRAGRIRQSVHPYSELSRGIPIRGVVYPHPRERVSRPPRRARRMRWAPPMSSPAESAPADPPAAQPSPEDRVISTERAGHIAEPFESFPIVSAWSSPCVTLPTTARAK